MSDPRKCDECLRPATRGRIVYRDAQVQRPPAPPRRVPDYAEFACVVHGEPRGGTPWGSVEHADEWERSDAPESDGFTRQADEDEAGREEAERAAGR